MAQVCVLPRNWWAKPWGSESYNNKVHPCCDYAPIRSNYSWEALAAHVKTRALRNGVLWYTGVRSGVKSLDQMLEGSGGNALMAAVSLCDSVDLYGIGLYSASPQADKVYVHAYDHGVGRCIVEPSGAQYRFSSYNRRKNAEAWLTDRVMSRAAQGALPHTVHLPLCALPNDHCIIGSGTGDEPARRVAATRDGHPQVGPRGEPEPE